jgi:2-oxoglutarate dehydrogenase E2 component (dihydrolipoamide succinyltransferase)
MSEKILVPELGESITEATVSKWLKKVGDSVEVDEAIVELETDKVNLEVPSPLSGILSEINSKDGDTVEVGAVLGSVSEGKSNVEKKTPSKEEKEIETVPEDLIKEENTNVINLEIEKKPNPKSGKISATSKDKPIKLVLSRINEAGKKEKINVRLVRDTFKVSTKDYLYEGDLRRQLEFFFPENIKQIFPENDSSSKLKKGTSI